MSLTGLRDNAARLHALVEHEAAVLCGQYELIE
jgi:hypothetical protein